MAKMGEVKKRIVRQEGGAKMRVKVQVEVNERVGCGFSSCPQWRNQIKNKNKNNNKDKYKNKKVRLSKTEKCLRRQTAEEGKQRATAHGPSVF